MKNKFLLVPAIALAAFCNAQKIEVKASYGAPSLFGIAENLTETVIGTFISSDMITYNSSGVLAVEALYNSTNPKWQYGLLYSRETVKDSKYNFTGNFNTILAEVNYTWNNPENKFKFYSGVGAGALFNNNKHGIFKENTTNFAFNVTPIGIRYGAKWGVFLETNIGTKGFAQGGVSYKF